MKKYLQITVIILITFLLSNCESKEVDPCLAIYGSYSGVIEGSFEGTITLVISEKEYDTDGSIEGTWSAIDQTTGDSYTGKINRTVLNCSTGQVDYEYGFNLSGPYTILCPASETWCYDSGATLGRFKGTINSGSGVGTWTANSGAAETVGVLGSGTWTVSKN